MKQHLARILIGLAITFFFISQAFERYRVDFIEQVDRIIYDARDFRELLGEQRVRYTRPSTAMTACRAQPLRGRRT